MMENIVPATPDMLIPQESDPIVTVAQKKIPPFLIFLIIALAIVTVLSIYLYLQVRTLTREKTTPSPIPTPISSTEPMPGLVNQDFQDNKASFSGSLQAFLLDNCIKGNPYSIEYAKLPITIDSKILKISPRKDGMPAYCSSTVPDSLQETYVVIYLEDNIPLNIYDRDSQELGHGGAPFLGTMTNGIYTKDNVIISAYFNFSEGPSLLGSLGISLRGQKEFTSKTGEKFYVNLNILGIPGNDPELMAALKPYSRDEGYDSSTIDTSKMDTAAMIESMFTPTKPGSTADVALAKMKKVLSAIAVQ